MHVYACLLLCFRSMFVWLDLGSCHALCLLWVCACWPLGPLAFLLAPIPPVVCWDATPCGNTSSWCWFARCIPFSTPCDYMLALLALCHPVWLSLFLCIFAHLPTCSCMCHCVCLFMSSSLVLWSCAGSHSFLTQDPESLLGTLFDNTCVVYTPISWNCGHPIQTYICSSRTHLLFDNMLVYPSFGSFCSFVLSHAFLLVVFLHVCWFCISLVVACAHLELGCLKWGRDFLGMSQKGQGHISENTQAQKGQCSVD